MDSIDDCVPLLSYDELVVLASTLGELDRTYELSLEGLLPSDEVVLSSRTSLNQLAPF